MYFSNIFFPNIFSSVIAVLFDKQLSGKIGWRRPRKSDLTCDLTLHWTRTKLDGNRRKQSQIWDWNSANVKIELVGFFWWHFLACWSLFLLVLGSLSYICNFLVFFIPFNISYFVKPLLKNTFFGGHCSKFWALPLKHFPKQLFEQWIPSDEQKLCCEWMKKAADGLAFEQ